MTASMYFTLQYMATHNNILQHTAAHCSTHICKVMQCTHTYKHCTYLATALVPFSLSRPLSVSFSLPFSLPFSISFSHSLSVCLSVCLFVCRTLSLSLSSPLSLSLTCWRQCTWSQPWCPQTLHVWQALLGEQAESQSEFH